MYRPSAFAVDDVAAIHDVMRRRVFATIAATHGGAVQLAYAPVVVDSDNGLLGGVRFHVAAQNPLATREGAACIWLSMTADDAYISPDWYETHGRVPTWNYVAVEGRGPVQRLDSDRLRHLLIDLSAAEEKRLAPKKSWTIDKVPEEKMATLLNAIVGFSVRFETLEGKFKLSQNVTSEDAEGVMRSLIQRGDPASRAIAKAMRKTRT